MTAMPFVSYERTVFYRERAASMYSSFPYSSALALVEACCSSKTCFIPHDQTMIPCCERMNRFSLQPYLESSRRCSFGHVYGSGCHL